MSANSLFAKIRAKFEGEPIVSLYGELIINLKYKRAYFYNSLLDEILVFDEAFIANCHSEKEFLDHYKAERNKLEIKYQEEMRQEIAKKYGADPSKVVIEFNGINGYKIFPWGREKA